MTVEAPKPVIAAVQGYALGGGFEIALSADIRVAATDAVFALPEIRYGLLPDTGGTQLLTHLVGPARAKYLVLSGNRIDARTALDWGIVDFVVEPGELQSFAHDLAARIAAHDPLPLSLGKQLVDQAHATSFRTGLRQELVAQTALFSSPDYRARKAAANESGKET